MKIQCCCCTLHNKNHPGLSIQDLLFFCLNLSVLIQHLRRPISVHRLTINLTFFWTPEWTVHGGPLLSMDTSMGVCGHDRGGPLRYTDARRGPFGVHFGVHFDVHFGVRGLVHKRPRSCPILCPPMSTDVHRGPPAASK